MAEYSAVSRSSSDVDDFVAVLNEKAREGWKVVSVVSPGSDQLTAILEREGTAWTAETGAADDAVASGYDPTTSYAAAGSSTASTSSDVTEPAGWATAPEQSTPTYDTAASSQPGSTTAETAVTSASSTASGSTGQAPAGWYPDPSGRYELRYWDGSAWTAHVSRGGQQFSDPPTA